MLRTELCTGHQNPAKLDSYPKGGGEVCWFSSESVDRSGMLLKNISICGDNKLLGTIPESPGVVWKGLCLTCFKSVNKSLFMEHHEKLLLLHLLPTSRGPTDLIPSLPQIHRILLGVSSYWSSSLLLAAFAPSPPYLSELPITAALLCRGTSNTELCMLLWLKQTKRISLFKE